jgi:hypothetical protein
MHLAQIGNSIQQDTKKNGICKNIKPIGITQAASPSKSIHGYIFSQKLIMGHKKLDKTVSDILSDIPS